MRWVCLVVACAGCASAGGAPVYRLSSPDEGVAWHLHTKDGALVCELPCEATVATGSGDYLAVHDPAKSWRVELPSAVGTHAYVEPHVGKGSPPLGTLGTGMAVLGATAAFAGVGMVLTPLAGVGFCPSGANDGCSVTAGTVAGVGSLLMAVGATLASVGVYLMEHNRAARAHVHVGSGTFGLAF